MREITDKDIEFLKELQEEMNTQDTDCQAEPRYWTIAGSERKYVGEDYGDESCVVSEDSEVAGNLDEFVEYIKSYCEDELNEHGITIEVDEDHTNERRKAYMLVQRTVADLPEEVEFSRTDEMETEDDVLDFLSDTYEFCIRSSNIEMTDDKVHVSKIEWDLDEDVVEDYIIEISEMIEKLVEYSIIEENDYQEVFYTNEHHVYPNTMFITKKDAKEHLEDNYYHYSKDAHTYAMTAWRSPSMTKLYDILHNVDWSKVEVKKNDD
jgi:hypothetical protein